MLILNKTKVLQHQNIYACLFHEKMENWVSEKERKLLGWQRRWSSHIGSSYDKV